MTWVIKHRRSPGSVIVADYECPECGVFEATVARDEDGDPPDEIVCNEIVCHAEQSGGRCDSPFGWPGKCSDCGQCGLTASWRPTSAFTRVQRVVAARRGRDPERPANCLDWQGLAYEERDPVEIEAKERKKDFENVRKIIKGALR